MASRRYSDQGSQFTGFVFTALAGGRHPGLDARWTISSSGSLAQILYLHEIPGFQARRLIGEWVRFYNLERPHSALDGRTPAEAYRGEAPVDMMDKPLRALPTSPQAQQQQDRFKGILAA